MKRLTTAELKAERDRVLHEIEMEKLYTHPAIVGSEEFNVAMVRRYGGILLRLNKAIEARERNMER